MAKSPEEMTATMVANLKEKTGKTMEQWLKITKAAKLEKHGQILKMLKTDYGVTHGFANLIALQTLSAEPVTEKGADNLVDAQYSGDKAPLRPIYEAIVAMVNRFGPDVEIAPKKTYVSLRRNKQFGLIQPSTKSRVDLGINLKGEKPTGRFEASGSFNSMVSHRVRLESRQEVNAELEKWLKAAYDAA